MNISTSLLALLTPCTLAFVACAPPVDPPPDGQPLLPDVTQAVFVDGVDHAYLPMPAGATWVYEAQTPDGLERIEIEVLADRRDVNGVDTVQVKDTAFLDGVLREDTIDWYAQDDDGNVWYLGEETCEYEDDACVSTAGSWEYGVDGALPGFAMRAAPSVDGQPYMQENYPGEAQDVGEVISVDETIETPAGTFSDCARTHDTSLLDPELDENKLYCRGIGVVLVEENVDGEQVREQLIETSLD